MTPEERDIIVNFISRVSGASAPASNFGSVPSTAPAPALPPVDREADQLIAQQFDRNPEARYRLTQLAFVQEHALAEAQNRLKQMEWQLQQAQQQAQQAQAQAAQQPQPSRGFLGGLFGGGGSQPQPQGVWGQGGNQAPPGYQQAGYQQQPPPPQYAPGYQQGMFQRQGSGFLGSALTTAAGVAGGVVAGNALMNMFSGGHEGGGLFGGERSSEGGAASPWAGGGALPAPQPGPVDQSAWSTPPDQTTPNADNAWAQPQAPDPSGWADNSGGGGDWASDNSGSTDDDSFT